MSWADDGVSARHEIECPPCFLTVESARALIEAVSFVRTLVSESKEGRHEEAARSVRGSQGGTPSTASGGGSSPGNGVVRRSRDQAGRGATKGGSR